MSYQEKKTITSIVSALILMGAYTIDALGRYRAGAAPLDNLGLWAWMMLKYIGIGIVVTIVLQILFHILLSVGIALREKIRDEKSDDKAIERTIKGEMVEDERDKLIELKSLRVGFGLAGAGFIAALFSLVLGYPPAAMLNILFFSFFAGSILEGFSQLFFYRRGF
ncbi:MAG TPA: hypothetical protein DCG47_07995 [Spirochaetaceae bacterium]|jgi:hypothetical protein|nr:hypothetical protein [Spirochaetaceae bacterium]